MGVAFVFLLFTAFNLGSYLPMRLHSMRGLYGISREMLLPFQQEFEQPTLVIVHPEWWTEYGGLLELQDPFLESRLLIAFTQNRINDEALAEDYIGKGYEVFHYYPDEPDKFYLDPRPSP